MTDTRDFISANLELTYSNEENKAYKDGIYTRRFSDIRESATSTDIQTFGQAIESLTAGDVMQKAVLVTREMIQTDNGGQN
ncbi:DUF1659 domain-containing protein [Holzapfeliella sp. JNUCC 80]